MKRIELMSKEEICNLLDTVGKSGCGICPIEESCETYDDVIRCCEAVAKYLSTEITVKKVPRFLTAKSIEDFAKLHKEYSKHCCNVTRCEDCKYSNHLNPNDNLDNCLIRYMAEEIEIVEEVES